MTRNRAVPRPAPARGPATGKPELLGNPHPLLIRTSLGLAAAFGFLLGVYLVVGFAFGLPLAASTPALMQVHGQVQALGFVALFIMAVGVQLFPRFHSSRLDRPRQVSIGGLLLATGLVLRVVAQPLGDAGPVRPVALVLSGLLELAGVAIAVQAFARVIRNSVQPAPRGFAALLPLTMAGSLVTALVVNLWASVDLARGSVIVPFARDEALLHLELWGFASTMVLAVAGRVFPKFLLLQPTRERLVPYALVLWAVGSFGVPLVWLALDGAPPLRALGSLAQLAGAGVYVAALRLYELPARPSGMPHVTDPTRRWARLAFAFMLAAAAADFGLAAAEALGLPPPLTSLSAARHALAQGFLLPVIVVMAARILPGYSGYMLHRPRLLAALVWTLLAGAALRFIAELLGGYAPGWGAIVALAKPPPTRCGEPSHSTRHSLLPPPKIGQAQSVGSVIRTVMPARTSRGGVPISTTMGYVWPVLMASVCGSPATLRTVPRSDRFSIASIVMGTTSPGCRRATRNWSTSVVSTCNACRSATIAIVAPGETVSPTCTSTFVAVPLKGAVTTSAPALLSTNASAARCCTVSPVPTRSWRTTPPLRVPTRAMAVGSSCPWTIAGALVASAGVAKVVLLMRVKITTPTSTMTMDRGEPNQHPGARDVDCVFT